MDGYIFIKLNNKCNNLCNFCADNWQTRNKKDPSFEEIKNEINTGLKKGFRKLIISGGEPTISPILLPTLKFAKKKDIELIHLATNGRMLSIDNYFEKINQFVDRYQVSVYAFDPINFDKISNVKNAFKQTIKAIYNISKANKKIITNIVITKDNYRELKEIFILLYSLRVRHIQFAFPNPTGFAKENNVFVKYEQIIPEILKIVKIKEYLNDVDIGFENFPICIFKDYKKIMKYLSDLNHPPENKEYYTISKIQTDKCKGCKFSKICEGLFKEYYSMFGDSELNRII